MCGIAGIYHLNNSSIELQNLQRFTDAMKHRGPDGAGYELYEGDTLGFGHRRLSILDLSEAGKQPFHYLERYTITFNGEIYNFLEIRKELSTKGYSFKTDTDTEVILSAYHEYGKDCLYKFNGMFAFAIWDKIEHSLFLARDRYGVKPLHYLHIPGHLFAFASETIAFKHLQGFKRAFDETNLATSVRDPGYIEAAGKTIFKHIFQLLPGHTMTIGVNKQFIIERWWNTADHLVTVDKDYTKQVEEFKDLFFSACKLRMRSDVPIASALSGGLDSSSVYCTLQQFKNNGSDLQRIPADWQKAFIATFPGTNMDERKYAEEVINYTKGKAVYITPDYSNLVNDIISTTKLFDAIVSNPLIAITGIYKAMRQNGIVVSLDGHGADEYAFGYTHYVTEAFYKAMAKKNREKATEYAGMLSTLSPLYDKQTLMSSFDAAVSVTSRVKQKLKTVFGKSSTSIGSPETSWFNKETTTHSLDTFANPFSGISKTLFDDFHYYSLPVNLRDFDRASMQHSIEIRMPFMDYRLVNYMFSLPEESKIGNGYTKCIIRDAMKGIVPEPIRTRTLKIGIGSPIAEWTGGPLKEFISDSVHSKKLQDIGIFNTDKIRNSVDSNYKHTNWNTVNASKTWSVINALLIDE
jgi:asparagine synthase (glutamine-hydrolysing)